MEDDIQRMEYTLEDAFETLKDAKTERVREIEDLIDALSMNDLTAYKEDIDSENIRINQHKYCQHLLNQVLKERPKDYPVLKTSDLHVEVLKELEEEVQTTQKLLESLRENLSYINDDISYLENKKIGLKKMKQTSLEHTKMVNSTMYIKEYAFLKRLFQTVKTDLRDVVNVLFPENEDLIEFLAALTTSYIKGGDDAYIDVTQQVLDFTTFLIEADIIVYHRNDKSKVKLIDML
ncbi:uncharacterized protein LOC128879104 [Hylaeus volcanicus]|uniref:uncharacterized protein LOC128879104 n=1 Tax=Hylaeus volcanicus TaxID=313075 RepID=UPI0023B86C7E|nr:uncharacterized protein LOC128879104 [Hylaeus volcanicus]